MPKKQIICQVASQLPAVCCGYRSNDPGVVYGCEVVLPLGEHRHRIGDHTIEHALRGNGHSCEAIEARLERLHEAQAAQGWRSASGSAA